MANKVYNYKIKEKGFLKRKTTDKTILTGSEHIAYCCEECGIIMPAIK